MRYQERSRLLSFYLDSRMDLGVSEARLIAFCPEQHSFRMGNCIHPISPCSPATCQSPNNKINILPLYSICPPFVKMHLQNRAQKSWYFCEKLQN